MSLYQDVRAKLFPAVRAKAPPVKASLTMLWQWHGFLPSCFRPLPNPFHTKGIAEQCRFSVCLRIVASGFPPLRSIPLSARTAPTSCTARKTSRMTSTALVSFLLFFSFPQPHNHQRTHKPYQKSAYRNARWFVLDLTGYRIQRHKAHQPRAQNPYPRPHRPLVLLFHIHPCPAVWAVVIFTLTAY